LNDAERMSAECRLQIAVVEAGVTHMPESRRIQYAITSGYIQLVVEDRSMPAFWAYPSLSARFPGVILLHDEYGLNGHVRSAVRRLAESGFYVIAPDLFDGRVPTTPEQAHEVLSTLGEAGLPPVLAAMDALRTHHQCNGKIGVVGWGIGGQIAYQLAALREDLKAVVAFYAQPRPYLATLTHEDAPVLGIYGDADPEIPLAVVEQLGAAISQAPGGGSVILYPSATAGFFNTMRSTYHEAIAADAWHHLITFLGSHLDIPRASTSEQKII